MTFREKIYSLSIEELKLKASELSNYKDCGEMQDLVLDRLEDLLSEEDFNHFMLMI